MARETVRLPDLRPTGTLAGGVGAFSGGDDPEHTFAAAFVPSRKYGWIVAVTWPAEVAFGPVESSHRQQLVGFGALAAVALAGALWLSHFMTGPIRRVIEQAAAIGEGHLDRRVRIRTLDELEHLGDAFNAMAERLESTRDALVHERAAAESERAAAQRAHRDLQQFLGFVAHDLRTPIAGVKASVGVILAHEPEDFPRPLSRMLRGVDTAADRMTKLVADLLDAARIGEGRFTVRPRTADLAAIVRRVADQQRVLTPDRRLMVDTPGTLPGQWDPERLEQVFANLIGNAVKFSPGGTPVRIALEASAGYAAITVADHGAGIAPEDLPRLFRPFSRLVPVDTDGDTVRGTGLGLYISRAIVRAHGGEMWVESEGPNTGTRVTVRLPILTSAWPVPCTHGSGRSLSQ
jgi:signal transduction histidine kinase